MFCSQCGKKLADFEKFCTRCGHVVDKYGGFWKRFFAWLLDSVLINSGFFILGGIIGEIVVFLSSSSFESQAPAKAMVEGLKPFLLVIEVVLYWLYYTVFESSSKQATLGKLALGIKVTDIEGNRLSFGRATGRHFSKFLSVILLGFGFIMIAFTEKKQGLHDIIAGCLVINC